jgi:putative transposase
LARFYARLANRRRDALHKITTKLAKSHGRLVIEDLRVKNMTASAKGTIEDPGHHVRQKAGLNRVLLDHAFAEFRRQLAYKARWYGSVVIAVNPAFTSQRCSRCGHTETGNRMSRASKQETPVARREAPAFRPGRLHVNVRSTTVGVWRRSTRLMPEWRITALGR